MPTIFSHPAVPLALGFGFGREIISRRLLWPGLQHRYCQISMWLPLVSVFLTNTSLDIAGSATHFFSPLLVALLGACARRWLDTSFGIAFGFLFLATASHGSWTGSQTAGLALHFCGRGPMSAISLDISGLVAPIERSHFPLPVGN